MPFICREGHSTCVGAVTELALQKGLKPASMYGPESYRSRFSKRRAPEAGIPPIFALRAMTCAQSHGDEYPCNRHWHTSRDLCHSCLSGRIHTSVKCMASAGILGAIAALGQARALEIKIGASFAMCGGSAAHILCSFLSHQVLSVNLPQTKSSFFKSVVVEEEEEEEEEEEAEEEEEEEEEEE